MTRKDYVLLARALADSLSILDNVSTSPATVAARSQQWRADVESVANALAGDNAAFDKARFLKACGE
jgi:hypothetical protein